MLQSFLRRSSAAITISFFCVQILNCQTVSSPYSIVGLGDLETRSIDRYSGMSSASTALQSSFFLNTSNPAALAGLAKHFVLFEVAGKGRRSIFSNISSDSTPGTSSDFAVKRLALAFKASDRMGFSFGFKPYSSVNYSFQSVGFLDGESDAYLRTTEGSGGLQQAYMSNGIKLNKNFSLGYTVSYLFGSLNQQVNYYSVPLELDVTKNNNVYLQKFLFQAGIQYQSSADKNFQHYIGATVSFPTSLNKENSYKIQEGTTDATTDQILSNTHFQVPIRASFGYAATIHKSLTLSADYTFQNWKPQGASIQSTNIAPAYRAALGGEYAFYKKGGMYAYEKYYLQSGIFYENTYWKTGSANVEDYGFTLGGGVNVGRINLFCTYEIGQRGRAALKQIPEKYTQFTLGITFKDLWEKSKFSRYD